MVRFGIGWAALQPLHPQRRTQEALAHPDRTSALLPRPRLDAGDGEALPVFRPPLDMTALFGESPVGENESGGISVRYLTPHNKWAIHSMYQENFYMMNLSRGGQNIWMSVEDAEAAGITDNDWVDRK